MVYYTNEERRDLLLLKLDHRQSNRRTALMFHQMYPLRPIPSDMCVKRLMEKFRSTGSVFNRRKSGRPKSATSEENAVLVLGSVALKSQQSLKEISMETATSISSVWRILHEFKFHPYKVHLVQQLYGNDFNRRLDFCELMETKIRDPNYSGKICFSDEATFHLNGYVNRHNCRYWCEENPYEYRQEHVQTPLKINVWAGIFGNVLIGPYFIVGNLNRHVYLDLLQNHVVPAIQAVALAQNIPMADVIFQQDGHPAHYARIVTDYLHLTFPQRWGYLKDKVFRTSPGTLQVLRDRIIDECANLSGVIIQKSVASFEKRLFYCMEQNGHQFEHLN